MASWQLRDLYLQLNQDDWRKANPFSKELAIAADVLTNPFASAGQRQAQLNNWLQGKDNQPCLFGRVAAARNALHYCLINDEDILTRSDEDISAQIHADLLAWKRRSLSPHEGLSRAAHGFVLSVASRRLAMAAPDKALLAFSQKVRELWGCRGTRERAGEIYWETLYLENPQDQSLWQFTISIDFFAAQGDGRWWRDHRAPGGILFTANSIGHMRRYREWYEKHPKQDQTEWALRTAMLTIDTASKTPYGMTTWLKPLVDGQRPIVDVACPFANPDSLKENLRGRDWTRYGGFFHSDHSIRPEFFRSEPDPLLDVSNHEYLQDFTYLFDQRSRDHWRLVAGERVAKETVDEAIGSPETWMDITPTPRPRPKSPPNAAASGGLEPISGTSGGDPDRIAALLRQGQKWRMTPEEVREALDG